MRQAMKVTITVLCLLILRGTGAQCGAPFPFAASIIADPPAEAPATGPGIGIDPVLPAAQDGTPPGGQFGGDGPWMRGGKVLIVEWTVLDRNVD